MANWKVSLLALAVAIAFFGFAIMWKPWIILAGALVWFGMRWLIRHHPMAAIALVGFLRGLLAAGEMVGSTSCCFASA